MAHQLPPEVRVLTEDDLYRTSSQFRLWSFSPESLAALRRKTHEIAIERIEKQRQSGQNGALNGDTNGTAGEQHSDYLTLDEEIRLVQRYCEMIRITNDNLGWPVNVKATAIQYLRRFYLSNSPLTYPPKEIYKTALYLANKTESLQIGVSNYAYKISANAEEILATEYKVMQALRFTLDVRQPNRGLKGVVMELLNMVEGMPKVQYREDITRLGKPGKGAWTTWQVPSGGVEGKHIKDRVEAAWAAARELLDAPALLTDVYFLYTPSQIVFAALQIADPALTDYYLSTKLPADSPMRPRVLATIGSCAEIMAGFSKEQVLSKAERAGLEAKLEACRDPSTKDIVKSHQANKQGNGTQDEDKAKRRKLQRDASAKEGEDLFGPSLASTNGAKG